jgi:iron complex transport system substrate-binding protein
MYPQRIVCLTEEPTEVLYALGEQQRIVGISGFTVRPAEARREKPRVSAFTSAKTAKILALRPDLAIGFSDLQADIARDLIAHGVEVWISNHRSVEGILGYVRRLGALVGASEKAEHYALRGQGLARRKRRRCRATRGCTSRMGRTHDQRHRLVSELIGLAGGADIFPERAAYTGQGPDHRGRGRSDRPTPDVILGSWCGSASNPPPWPRAPAGRPTCGPRRRAA